MNDSQCPDGWSVRTLHEHVLRLMDEKEQRDSERFAALKEATAMALAAADRAVAKAEAASDRRFDSVNEFRNTLGDQQRLLMPRVEAELRFNNFADELRILKEAALVKRSEGAGLHQGWLILVALLGLIGSITGIIAFFRHP